MNRDRAAGVLAIAAGLCWCAWAVATTLTGHGLERAAPGSSAAAVNTWLTAGWNLLLVPAALRLLTMVPSPRPATTRVATAAGIASLLLWALAAFVGNSHALETMYLSLAAVWLIVLGSGMRPTRPAFGSFTFLVGAFTALDSVFNLLEPVPFAVYVLAAPKLPLSAAWSITTGVLLLRQGQRDHAPHPAQSLRRDER